jgi:NAD-dependent SIR2 family protein deacetylase
MGIEKGDKWNHCTCGSEERLYLSDLDKNYAVVQCDECGKIFHEDCVFYKETYEDKELTILYEDIIYCVDCARDRGFDDKQIFEDGCYKEWAFNY